MKLSNAFKFALLGATALTLVACGEPDEDVLAYQSAEACIKAGQQDEAVCRAEFDKAKKLHNQVAPRYRGERDCISDFGYNRCYSHRTSGGSSVWLPFMMGYMLAPRGRTYVASQPLYRSSSDPSRYYTSTNGPVGGLSANGRAHVSKSKASRPAARTRTVSRGGFGARATRGWGAGG